MLKFNLLMEGFKNPIHGNRPLEGYSPSPRGLLGASRTWPPPRETARFPITAPSALRFPGEAPTRHRATIRARKGELGVRGSEHPRPTWPAHPRTLPAKDRPRTGGGTEEPRKGRLSRPPRPGVTTCVASTRGVPSPPEPTGATPLRRSLRRISLNRADCNRVFRKTVFFPLNSESLSSMFGIL